IVGRKPSPEVIALHEVNGCNVWGMVEDIRPWLKAADMALVPLNIARGVQNKVLEAMAMCLPTVLTPGAATGIGANNGKQLVIAESDEELAHAAIKLLQDTRRARIKGLAARNFVCDHANWQSALAPLLDIVGVKRRATRNAA
ncbi:MAG: glycosyltransferase, partial [Novosphingobium sp.]